MVIGKHNNMYYISHQSSLLRLSPQRLIGVPDAEIIKDSEEIDQEGSGGRLTFSNPEDHMDFERVQIETEIGGDVPENEEENQDRDNHEGENVGDGNQEENEK